MNADVTRRESHRLSIKKEPTLETESSLEETFDETQSTMPKRVVRNHQRSPRSVCHSCLKSLRFPRNIGKVTCVYDAHSASTRCSRCKDLHHACALVPLRVREDATRLMAMNEALCNREPGAPTAQQIVILANSIFAKLGQNSAHKRSAPKRKSDARAVPSSTAAIPQVTTNLRAEDFPRSPVRMQASIVSGLRGTRASSDDGSIHHSPSGSPIPIDAVAEFLNARPRPTNAATRQDWSPSEADSTEPPGADPQTLILTNILDALRQGVEIYARVNGQQLPVWPDKSRSRGPMDDTNMSG